jgi:hypothetical protein
LPTYGQALSIRIFLVSPLFGPVGPSVIRTASNGRAPVASASAPGDKRNPATCGIPGPRTTCRASVFGAGRVHTDGAKHHFIGLDRLPHGRSEQKQRDQGSLGRNSHLWRRVPGGGRDGMEIVPHAPSPRAPDGFDRDAVDLHVVRMIST